MVKVTQLTKIVEVMPYVWNVVFELNDTSFLYTTDLLYLRNENCWVISKKIPHELTSLLAHNTCPLCNHNGISCKVATEKVETIIQAILRNDSFRKETLRVIGNVVDDSYSSYQFVKNKREWSQLYRTNG